MDNKHLEIYTLTDKREAELWQNAVFVFDTSALLGFYSLPISTRKQVFDELFQIKLKNRLWIPNHVQYEYAKNREKVITKPFSEVYLPLQNKIFGNLKTSVKDILRNTEEIINRTKKDDKHPYLPQDAINKFFEITKSFEKEAGEFESWLKSELDRVREEMEEVSKNDDVNNAISNYFIVGRYYSFEEIIEITKEGKHRYEFSIPPGYEDLKNDKKKGTQIFGDLIMWKQLLEFAKEKQKPIILIINDVKADWCHKQESSNENRIDKPREELLKEIYDHAGVEFWMYDQPSFLYNSNKYFKADIEKRKIYELAKELRRQREASALVFTCKECNAKHIYTKDELELEFECIGSYERNMGAENQYQANEYFDCDCGNHIEVTFDVWEYPVGAHNHDTVEIAGGKILNCFTFSIDFHDEPDDPSDLCGTCGKPFHDEYNIGICSKCEAKYVNS